MTFEQCAQDLLEAKRSGWKNAKHAQQWINTLRDYAFPVIGAKAPAEVTLADVKSILLPIWTTKTETASRVRQRIEAVLDYAAVYYWCDGTRNPARWKGILNKVLPEPGKVSKREHHAASACTDIPRIMAALRDKSLISAYCLQFTILTAARSGEYRVPWCHPGRGRSGHKNLDDTRHAHESRKTAPGAPVGCRHGYFEPDAGLENGQHSRDLPRRPWRIAVRCGREQGASQRDHRCDRTWISQLFSRLGC